jgi:hypothetical protein
MIDRLIAADQSCDVGFEGQISTEIPDAVAAVSTCGEWITFRTRLPTYSFRTSPFARSLFTEMLVFRANFGSFLVLYLSLLGNTLCRRYGCSTSSFRISLYSSEANSSTLNL